MKSGPFILRMTLLAAALSGAVAVIIHIFTPSELFAPRREYDLELRFVMNLPFKSDTPPEKAPPPEKASTPEKETVVPARFRELIAAKAQKYAFEFELIAAIIARESNFDPRCTAPDGGKGLMQLMPAVCRERRCADPFDPESNLEAGVAHLAALRESFSDLPDPAERIKFALASYNGGRGHVMDARRLAVKLKLDPDKWQGNVEEAIQFLKYRSFWKSARHGYCNADIVVNYVNSVLALTERFQNN